MDLKTTAVRIHKTAIKHGWWDDDNPRSFGDVMMMIVTECAEAVEHYRNGQELDKVWFEANGKPDGIPVEFADILIRLLDASERYNMDIEEAIKVKMKYNDSREYRHGYKLL